MNLVLPLLASDDVYPLLEQKCIEGTRAESKYAVAAIDSLIQSPNDEKFARLCEVGASYCSASWWLTIFRIPILSVLHLQSVFLFQVWSYLIKKELSTDLFILCSVTWMMLARVMTYNCCINKSHYVTSKLDNSYCCIMFCTSILNLFRTS